MNKVSLLIFATFDWQGKHGHNFLLNNRSFMLPFFFLTSKKHLSCCTPSVGPAPSFFFFFGQPLPTLIPQPVSDLNRVLTKELEQEGFLNRLSFSLNNLRRCYLKDQVFISSSQVRCHLLSSKAGLKVGVNGCRKVP